MHILRVLQFIEDSRDIWGKPTEYALQRAQYLDKSCIGHVKNGLQNVLSSCDVRWTKQHKRDTIDLVVPL